MNTQKLFSEYTIPAREAVARLAAIGSDIVLRNDYIVQCVPVLRGHGCTYSLLAQGAQIDNEVYFRERDIVLAHGRIAK